MSTTLQKKPVETRQNVVILFAGDSGDGIQLTGSQFTDTNALFGNDVSTFPNFPAEIRAPQGTLAGVSGYQLHFGSVEIFTPGDQCDVLVVMNAAALKANLGKLKVGGTIIANTDGFDKKNLRLAGIPEDQDPLTDHSLANFHLHSVDVTKLTRTALESSALGMKEKDRCKNMFVLGFINWMYSRENALTEGFLQRKFSKKPDVLDANMKALVAGYNYGETSETFTTRFEVKAAPMPKGTYRSITGNQGTALGLIAGAQKAKLDLFYGSYPITPASDILHELSRHKNFGVITFQAEDEIAAISSAIGASYGGAIGITASSGPGIALKTEAMGLAFMLELPLVIVNVQRGGPSTGLPTKTEQADLWQAVHGRNGEAPIPVIAASTPIDCFDMAFEAVQIAIEHMTPVILLTDGYIANGSEPWRYPEGEGSARDHSRPSSKHRTTATSSCPTCAMNVAFVRGPCPASPVCSTASAGSRSRTRPATSATTLRTTRRWCASARRKSRASPIGSNRSDWTAVHLKGNCSSSVGVPRTARSARRRCSFSKKDTAWRMCISATCSPSTRA